MMRADVIRALLLTGIAAMIAAEAPVVAVLAALGLSGAVGAVFIPAKQALVPTLVESPSQLTAMNVVSGAIENTGMFLGPALGGLLLVATSPQVVFLATALTLVWSAFMVSGIDIDDEPREVSFHPRAIAAEVRDGVSAVTGTGPLRVIVGLYATQCIVAGALGVLIVVVALDQLELGDQWVGFLDAAVGVGGLIGAAASVALIGRKRLSGAFGVGMLLWGAPIAALALYVSPGAALAAMLVVGIGNSVGDVTATTMLQRSADESDLPRVFGGLEFVVIAGFALGGIACSLVVESAGAEAALAVFGLLLPALLVATWFPLRAIDALAVPPGRPLELLRGIPMFSVLTGPVVERLALRAERVVVPAGTPVFSQGDAGDRYYLIDEGSADIVIDNRHVRTQTAGSGFGEIALVRDVPRTATVNASEELVLWAIERDDFLTALGTDPAGLEQAESLSRARLAWARPAMGVR
jgi:predicted MFS family arabinose efflux permease